MSASVNTSFVFWNIGVQINIFKFQVTPKWLNHDFINLAYFSVKNKFDVNQFHKLNQHLDKKHLTLRVFCKTSVVKTGATNE